MMRDLYKTMAETILEPEFLPSRTPAVRGLRAARGRAVALVARDRLHETAQPGAITLLAALLKNNTTLQELDLTATDVEKQGVSSLVSMLHTNKTLTSLKMAYNPGLDDKTKEALRAVAQKRSPPLNLEL